MAKASLSDIDSEIARRSLKEFVKQAWHVLEPETRLVWGWHIAAICDHLQAVTEGQIKRLIINVPPGHMKSLLVAVFWPAWEWLTRPTKRMLFGSYDMGLSTRDSVKCRQLLQSQWYRGTFTPRWLLRGDQNVKTWFENTHGGLRLALSVGGRGTGFRGDCIVADDPLNVKRSLSEEELEEVKFWWDKRLSSRLNDQRTGSKVVIMQRLHEDDLAGHLVRKGGYDLLRLPTEYDPDMRCETSLPFKDPRTSRGELLFPEMYPEEVVDEIKEDLGSFQFAGQHNQNPVPLTGGVLKKHWFRFWYSGEAAPRPVMCTMEDGSVVQCEQERRPDIFDFKFTSSDMAFKDKKESDYVAMGTWGIVGSKRYMLGLIWDHLSFVNTLAHFRALRLAVPDCIAHLVEDKANGTAILNVLENEVPALVAIEPQGSKIARCEAVAPSVEAGNVYLPHPDEFPWVDSFLLELCTFPKSKHDDRVDQLTQALNWLRTRDSERIYFA